MSEARIAYFSMEVALHPAMPTYSGGLGMLAGDMLRAAADRELPMVAVTRLHRKGCFYQTLDGTGWQTEDSVEWIVEDFLRELPHRAAVTLEGTTIQLRAWQYDVHLRRRRSAGGSCGGLDGDLAGGAHDSGHRQLHADGECDGRRRRFVRRHAARRRLGDTRAGFSRSAPGNPGRSERPGGLGGPWLGPPWT